MTPELDAALAALEQEWRKAAWIVTDDDEADVWRQAADELAALRARFAPPPQKPWVYPVLTAKEAEAQRANVT